MNRSSGIKRGLAATAVAALAVTGIPFAANATTINEQVSAAGPATNNVELYNAAPVATTKNDGANTTIRLQAGASSDVVAVSFQVKLDSAPDTAYADIPGATNLARNDDGSFSFDWDAANFVNTNVDIRVVEFAGGVGNVGDAAPDIADNVAIQPANGAADSVDIAAGSSKGAFQQLYTNGLGGPARTHIAVTGTTSAPNNTPIALNYMTGAGTPAGGNAGAVVTERAANAAFGTYAGALALTDYQFGGTNEVVTRAQVTTGAATTEDFEGFTLYNQQIGTVTAVAGSNQVAPNQTTPVVITVLDNSTTPAPIVGAEVRSSAAGNPLIGYTNARGQVTAQQGASTVFYYANSNDNDPFVLEEGDRRSADITVTQFTGGGNLVGASADGNAFDRDEFQLGDITVQATDGAGNPINPSNNQTLSYFFEVDPFAAGAPNTRIPAAPATETAVDGAVDDGRYDIVLPVNGPSGTYVLNAALNDDPTTQVDESVSNRAVLTFKVGDGTVRISGNGPISAPAGGEVSIGNTLALEDGTPLPGRTVNARYLAQDRVAGTDTSPDAGLRPATGSNLVESRDYITGADGTFTAVVDDPAETPQGSESGQYRAGGGIFAPAVGPRPVRFGATDAPAGSVVRISVPNTGKPGQATQGTVSVRTAANAPVANQAVTLTIGGNAYFTDGGFATGTVGQPAAVRSTGKTITVTTNGQGDANFQTSIGRSTGFDDDGLDTAAITATSGTLTFTETEDYSSAAPLNGGTLELVESADQDNPTDPTLVGDTVDYVVRTNDQFGNPAAGETVALTYTGVAAGAGGNRPATVTSNFIPGPDIVLTAAEAGTVTVNGTWNAPRNQIYVTNNTTGTGAAFPTTDSASEVFYEIDFADSTYSITSNAVGPRPVGAPVTVTVRVVDQEGRGVSGLEVDFIRSGPGDQQDGDPNQPGTLTNANGEAFYSFVGTEAGTARVSAVITEAGQSQPIRTLTTNVVFRGTVTPPPGKAPITAVASGNNNGAANDRVRVRTNGRVTPAGAQVRLFKKQGNRRVLVDSKRLNRQGRTTFSARDTNGARPTVYWVVVGQTERTLSDRSRNVRIR